jgi:hypothetical protein
MEIVFHLKGHCIETAAKKEYERLVKELLKEENEEKEQLLEMLVEFLKKANFSELRSAGFDGRKEMMVRVRRESDGFVVERI